jgi:pseudouridine-5'-phosphate glycosidase
VAKLSRADLALCLATGATGATTVAATMIAAHRAGSRSFATGGIGGVHRGAEESFDISADLRELAQTPVTVVAAGAKAILDLPKTLEVLETSAFRSSPSGRTPSPPSGRATAG